VCVYAYELDQQRQDYRFESVSRFVQKLPNSQNIIKSINGWIFFDAVNDV
jgi:hypothetical protein